MNRCTVAWEHKGRTFARDVRDARVAIGLVREARANPNITNPRWYYISGYAHGMPCRKIGE